MTAPTTHQAAPGAALVPDRYTGRTVTPSRGRFAGRTLTIGGRLPGRGVYLVRVDGCRLAWACGPAVRTLLDAAL